ncbi:PaaI family thioesterase [Nocardia sp. NPDC058176]|uniref:PaaI family thioesterase n=1 Tax=Nocardia sp. NPDC058176 TaxID=3346368 RepID=UPI0036DE2078
MIQTEAVTIPEHVHGYPQVAFGGYVAGMLARRSGAETVRVDFRRAVPVGTPVTLPVEEPGHASLVDMDGTLLVQAAPATLYTTPPPTPSWDTANAATESALASPKRQVTDCFGCGIECAPGHGLRLFSWAIPDHRIMTAAWTPDPRLADDTGELPPEIIWSALDCPGGLAAMVFDGLARGAVTAALTATRYRPTPADADYIVHAWPIHHDGRKHTVGVALSTRNGDLCALAEALWIGPRTAS